MKVRKFRILRLRHHVSMVELGRACGVSAQRISELELSENKPSAETVQKIQSGFEAIIAQRGRAGGRSGSYSPDRCRSRAFPPRPGSPRRSSARLSGR